MIPKKINIFWVGDENLRPDAFIQSWKDHHPDWEFRIWGNDDLYGRTWRHQNWIDGFLERKVYAGVVDVMRWELLAQHGGFFLDADLFCVRPLPDWMVALESVAVWDSQQPEGELIANGFVGAEAGLDFFESINQHLEKTPPQYDRWSWSRLRRVAHGPWKTVGPKCLTGVYRASTYRNLTVLPSHMILPHASHMDGGYSGTGPVFCVHVWGSTADRYGTDATGGGVADFIHEEWNADLPTG